MAKKFVKALGLHNIFIATSATELDITSIKTEVADRVNSNSIVFITADSGDVQYGYPTGFKYIWTLNTLYPTNSYDDIIKDDEEVIATIISKLNYTIGLDTSTNLVWSEESGLTADTIKAAIEYVSTKAGVKINDSSINVSETWSSLKISDELNNIDIIQINDSSIDSSVVWSSLKINNELLAVKGLPYLKFTANTIGSTIALTNYGGNAPDIKYSRDGDNWTQWDYSAITLTNAGDYVYMKGDNSQGFSSSYSKYSQFIMTGSIASSGNIMSLIDNGACQTFAIPRDYCYLRMFSECSSLTSAPELPATTLAGRCYSSMFEGCSGLTSAPELPATTLANYCYSSMFDGCSSLTSAPELPATTLVNNCYSYMFAGCSSLTSAPELPATTLADRCYEAMFYNCSSLTSAPELPATTLANFCYESMFSGCSSLSYIKCLATIGINENNSTTDWVSGVASTGTFIKDSNATWLTGANGIPDGWNYINLSDKQTYENGHICDSSVNSIAEDVLNGSIGVISVKQCIASGINSHAEGNGTTASDSGSHAEGVFTESSGSYVSEDPENPHDKDGHSGAHAEGYSTIASAFAAHAEGDSTIAIGYASHAEGKETVSRGNNSHASGLNTAASGKNSHAEGHYTEATGSSSHAEGIETHANAVAAHAEGYATFASRNHSHAEGSHTTANAKTSHTEGLYTQANGMSSHAEGHYAETNGGYSHAEGSHTHANGMSSHAEGLNTSTNGKGSHAEGSGSYTGSNAAYSHAEGDHTHTGGRYSHAEGYRTNSSGHHSHAEGRYTESSGEYSHAEGSGTSTSAEAAHSEGYNTPVESVTFTAETYENTTCGAIEHSIAINRSYIEYLVNGLIGSTVTSVTDRIVNQYLNLVTDDTVYTIVSANRVENTSESSTVVYSDILFSFIGTDGNTYTDYIFNGNYTISITTLLTDYNASGFASHTEGYTAFAQNTAAHAEGMYTMALGGNSHAEGSITIASGASSHAEGENTLASGDYSHAEGMYTESSGNYSHAEGLYTESSGAYSHAEGYKTQTNNDNEHAQGKYNLSHNNTIHSIGIGSKSTRMNAVEVLNNGDVYINGIGNYEGTDTNVQDSDIKPILEAVVQSDTVLKLWSGTQAQYDAISTKDNATLYLIKD